MILTEGQGQCTSARGVYNTALILTSASLQVFTNRINVPMIDSGRTWAMPGLSHHQVRYHDICSPPQSEHWNKAK